MIVIVLCSTDAVTAGIDSLFFSLSLIGRRRTTTLMAEDSAADAGDA
eukprot:CAMPEP_0198261732 /NCGR_PEP_ID=MMETSP1447-20131203/10407_1 /TAXON_ID=420782 /ORGANISM="Chaetoceros dichaeta, Strain CCMP1751" /LENGTH=46 /DNA_ID= /DNA_START= /DNA_END= /DNA_ORIENTATION=